MSFRRAGLKLSYAHRATKPNHATTSAPRRHVPTPRPRGHYDPPSNAPAGPFLALIQALCPPPFGQQAGDMGREPPLSFLTCVSSSRAKDRFSGKPGATREQGAGEEEGGCQAQRQPSPDLSPTLGRRLFFFAVAFRPDTRFAFLSPSKLPALSDWDAGRSSAARAAAVCHPQND